MTKKYPGISASLIARIKNTRTPINIDFGVGDVIVPGQEQRKIPTQLDDFTAPMVNTYSLETTVAEKLDAILYLMELSTRMKDYYDIFFLADKFEFDGATLSDALRETFRNREHEFSIKDFRRVMTFGDDEAMRSKWRAFCRKINIQEEDYSVVLETINSFLSPPYEAIYHDRGFSGHWSIDKKDWI